MRGPIKWCCVWSIINLVKSHIMKIKRPLIFYFAFLLGFSAMAQQGVQWSAASDVSTTQGDYSAVIGVLENNVPVILWGDGSTIYFSKKTNDEFSVPVSISTAGVNPDIYIFGGLDLATQGNSIHIVFENFTQGIFYIRSNDGGENFDAPIKVYDPPAGKWATIASLAISDNGDPLVSAILENTNETEGRYILMRSLDGGTTFELPVIANAPAVGEYVCECCQSEIYTKGDDVWLIFRNNFNNLRDIWVTKSSDGGATFTEGVDVDQTDWISGICPISRPNIAPLAGDSLMAVWHTGANGENKISLSSLNGTTMVKGFESEMPKSSDNSFQLNPVVAGLNDTIGIAWEENVTGGNDVDVMFAFSKNGYDGLLTNLGNITNASSSKRFPALDYSKGVFHLVHTSGSGGLQYRSGLVSEVSSTIESTAEFTCMRLVQQPVRDQKIRLKNSCTNLQNATAQLYDISGREVQSWNKNSDLVGNNLIFDLNSNAKSAGTYFLTVKSNSIFWSTKVLIGF